MLWQPSLPDAYHAMTDDQLAGAIAERRARLGEKLVILGHHYQTDEVIRHADFTGDSLKLSQLAASVVRERAERGVAVEHIIFCGVHFMAETADMLTPDSVGVILPDLSAGCSMADMAQYDDTVDAWEVIHAALRQQGWEGRIIPITYVNSSAAIKAFVGAHGGACCTSSNADQVFAWAMEGGTEPKRPGEDIKILFLPDQHLGRNTSAGYGINTDANTCVYDPRRAHRGEPLGGASAQELHDSVTILWAGHCSVHKLFRPEHCDQIRASEKDLPASEKTTILVHPECCKEVVDKSDLAGSTEFIIKALRDAEPGSKWAVGTEVHLVARMAQECARRNVHVRILSECQCLCTTMSRIDQPHLLWVLDGLCGVGTAKDAATDAEGGPAKARNIIRVHPEVREPALLALDRMLAHTGVGTPVD
ncbi:MAG: quinolinate synthase NadA [Phycisphaerales bacterium]|nr:quinolinate synthase NadA [Planctomycetota bacterium]MCH8509366.1 quinolinate synthase NadA [Phycisphaerales bacterium]